MKRNWVLFYIILLLLFVSYFVDTVLTFQNAQSFFILGVILFLLFQSKHKLWAAVASSISLLIGIILLFSSYPPWVGLLCGIISVSCCIILMIKQSNRHIEGD